MKKLVCTILFILVFLPFQKAEAAEKLGADYEHIKAEINLETSDADDSIEFSKHAAKKAAKLKELLSPSPSSAPKFQLLGEMLEKEPNDSLDQANSLRLDDYVYGSFSYEDLDMYKVEISEPGDLYITAAADYNIDLGYLLLDSSGEVVELTSYYYEDHVYSQTYSVEPGVYYIQALDLNGGGADGAYVLSAYFFGETPQKEVWRINGADRYETAIEIAENGWFEGADTIILARGFNFPDALAGAPLAYRLDAPILLNPKDKLHPKVRDAIREFGASKVIILGGTGAISASVEKELKDKLHVKTKRIGGTNRYETAGKIADELGYYDSAVLAYGGNYPDALSIASYAAVNGMPVLLTEKNNVPKATTISLEGVDDTIIVGGSGVISNQVKNEIQAHHPVRIAGKNRYDTSAQIVEQLGMDAYFMTVATGESYADALTGSVLAAKWQEPLVLVKKDEIPKEVKNLMEENNSSYFTILGEEEPYRLLWKNSWFNNWCAPLWPHLFY
ncbi:cell wall-binding repeat-containing protein [Halobacillus salinarum]|uniref:Cell wall-binding repeat-containing protein n=1 Tax=Halobacillus salinarum TaxID=2932257 RepID=A0ABY4EMB6_9BACI|nr:cell wall-binding repeat-containing protein [Halobacillus salinarum]UOQ45140.1 cell wall-binding repeat-containing protein [Halobacillus salinarum]